MSVNDNNVEQYIDQLINSIILLENQLNKLEKEKNELYYEQEKEAYYIADDIEKMRKRISLLKDLKKSDSISLEEELNKKEISKSNISNDQSIIQKEYSDLKSKMQTNWKMFLTINISSNDLDLTRENIENIQKKINKKEKLIKECDASNKIVQERLSLLKEEKNSTILSVQNLTSKTETLQEMLGNHDLFDTIIDKSFSLENKLNKTIDFLEKNLDCFNYEMATLDKEKITNEISNYLKEFFTFDGASFKNVCSICISIVNENKSLGSDDFFNLFSKKIFDLLKMNNKKKYLDIDVYFS